MTATDPTIHEHHRASAGRVVLAVFGVLLVLVGLGLGAIGGVLVWAHTTQRDDAGFFTTSAVRLEALDYAITSEDVDLGTEPGRADRRFDFGDLATVRLTIDGGPERDAFVGIAPASAAAEYLDAVGRAEVVDVQVDPTRVGYRYVAGEAPTVLPEDAGIWAVEASGRGPQTIEWELESGQWTVVVMNADGSQGVSVDVAVGVKADWVLAVGIGLAVAGLFVLLGGTGLLVAGAVGLARHPHPPAVAGRSPVMLRGELDPEVSPALWLVKVVLLIPHFVVLVALWIAFGVLTLVAGVSILFTGRYPRSLFDFNVGVLRWTWRVSFYFLGAFATDRYPPFTLAPVEDYPASLDIAPPETLSRGLVLVKWWLLAIPHYVVVAILVGGGMAAGGDVADGPGLITVLAVIAGVTLLFTRRYPTGIFDLLMGCHRWVYRVIAYASLMTDDYPPFRLDQGTAEPDADQLKTNAPSSRSASGSSSFSDR